MHLSFLSFSQPFSVLADLGLALLCGGIGEHGNLDFNKISEKRKVLAYLRLYDTFWW